ncbi:MAG: hypothetical protein DDT23_00375 [candidate division WS2 bacterium]|nr:hypothetical protein [Candidatus Lithacetigena glycinireducens]
MRRKVKRFWRNTRERWHRTEDKFFKVLFAITICLGIAIIISQTKMYITRLNRELKDCKQVVRTLQTKEAASKGIMRGLQIELDKCNKKYNECEGFRSIIRNLPVGEDIEFDKVIPLPGIEETK